MALLNNGDHFPDFKISISGQGNMALPADLAGSFGVVLIYRGAWCPVCNDQLAGFEAAKSRLDDLNVKIVALSVDDEPTTAALVEKLHLTFPVGFGADVDQVSAAVGSYTNAHPHYLQPTGFVLSPDGNVLNALYASNAMGRLTAQEVERLATYITQQAKAD